MDFLPLKESPLRYLNSEDIPRLLLWEKENRPYPWVESHFSETLYSATTRTLIYESEREIVGYAVVQIVKDEAYLLNIFIDPSKRKRGFGSFLIHQAMEWAKTQGASVMMLDVDTENTSAIDLYKNKGFSIIEKRPQTYPKGENSFLMKIQLS
jgi:ribosomal-protein-alanine N-acetyltransferase